MAEYTCPKCKNTEEFIRIIEAEVEQTLLYYEGEGLAVEEEDAFEVKKVLSVECSKCNYKGQEPEFKSCTPESRQN